MAKEEIGVIREQGDLGLHWEPVNEEDQNKMKTVNNKDDNKDEESSK